MMLYDARDTFAWPKTYLFSPASYGKCFQWLFMMFFLSVIIITIVPYVCYSCPEKLLMIPILVLLNPNILIARVGFTILSRGRKIGGLTENLGQNGSQVGWIQKKLVQNCELFFFNK